MRGCEIVWDEPMAQIAEQLIEMGTGKPCPCKSGGRCPILPLDFRVAPVPVSDT